MLDLAEIEYDVNTYDGMSWVQGGIVKPYSDGTRDKYGNITNWRDIILTQYGGNPWVTDFRTACPVWNGTEFPGRNVNPPCCNKDNQAWMTNDPVTNNWRAIRILNDTMNVVYAEFVTNMNNLELLNNPSFIEYYDIDIDPYQIDNLYGGLSENMKNTLHDLLMKYAKCNGTSCW